MTIKAGYRSAPVTNNSHTVAKDPLSRKELLTWLVAGVFLASLGIVAVAATISNMNWYDNSDPVYPIFNNSAAAPAGTGQAGYTFSEKWNVIKGPLGDVATRCDPLRDGIRIYLTPNQLVFEPDATCKK